MGIIIGKFKKKPGTLDVLTKLQEEINSIEDFQNRTRLTQRKIVFRFLILAIIIYTASAVLFYFYLPQISKNHQFLWWIIPLFTFPFLIWIIKTFLSWYYNRKIRKNEEKLVTLKEKKKKILENVMETETYKVAKEILDKFSNEMKKSIPSLELPASSVITPRRSSSFFPSSGGPTNNSVIRQRNLTTIGRGGRGGSVSTPSLLGAQQQQQQRYSAFYNHSVNSPLISNAASSAFGFTPIPQSAVFLPPPRTPRGMLPPNRSALDKVVEYFVGDGPSNRYALICTRCSRHNGMALKEEFEYLQFTCGYCNSFNPARKQRIAGPKFDSPLLMLTNEATNKSSGSPDPESSNSERNSEKDSDTDSGPIIEEARTDSPDTPKTSDFEKVSDSELLNDVDDNNRMDIDNSENDSTKISSPDVEQKTDPAAVEDL